MVTTTSVKIGATYQDVIDAPDDKIAELIHGTLYLSPRPATAANTVGANAYFTLRSGVGGKGGGWLFGLEQELHLDGHVLVPDVCAWRRDRLSELPSAGPAVTVVPDWVCEVLSPSTEKYDRGPKLATYGELGVPFLWFVHPLRRTLEVLRRQRPHWVHLGQHSDHARVCVEPFGTFELDLANLWENLATFASEPVAEYGR